MDNQEQEIFPADIKGYGKQGQFYRSFNAKDIDPFFAVRKTEGKAELYFLYGDGVTADGESDYIFRKKNMTDFTFMRAGLQVSYKQHAFEKASANSMGTYMDLSITSNEESFRSFFSDYFKDCPTVSNKVKSKFYLVYDVESMFKEYNTCR